MADYASSRVLYIGETGPIQQQIQSALGTGTEFELIDFLTTTERMGREIFTAEPNIILVDHRIGGGESQIDVIAEIARQFPDISPIAILGGEDISLAQKVLLAGARAFLIQPFTQINLVSTLQRVRDLEVRRTQLKQTTVSRAEEVEQPPLRVLAVYSPRGGVGCSTIAANLALSIFEETNLRILLLEGKLFFGHFDVMLNIRTQNSIADLIPHSSNLDDNLIRDVVSRHASGLHVLMGPNDIQVAQGIRPDDLYNVFIGLQRMYDFIVIDAGSTLNENTVTLMDAADKILLVTTPDLASLHDTSKFIQFSRSLAYPQDKLLVALNRSNITGGLRSSDIESALHYPLFAQIPDDGANALRSINRGIPFTTRYPRNPVSRSIRSLADSLIELNNPDSGQAKTKKTKAPRGGVITAAN
jgi:pilus assembly protein CpaE